MYTLACKSFDPNIKCDFVATGSTQEETFEKSIAHAMTAHAEQMKNAENAGVGGNQEEGKKMAFRLMKEELKVG